MCKTREKVALIVFIILTSCTNEQAPQIEGMVFVPAGEFIRGSSEVDEDGLAKQFGSPKGEFYLDERPEIKKHLDSFYIDKYEVTNEAYSKFIKKIGAKSPPSWYGKYSPPVGTERMPAVEVTWMHANAYCSDAGKRLPTEEEWEKAARGPDGNKYPWGNDYNKTFGNLTPGKNTEVGSFEKDISFYGAYDMGGNVMEWVDAWYKPYEGNTQKNKEYHKENRVLRGGYAGNVGHYTMNSIFARTSYRHFTNPNKFTLDLGFRCAKTYEKTN